jgi:23S rRNA (cytidine2498-2'-O)-methyltransferase
MSMTAYLAPEGLEKTVELELQNITDRHERLFVAKGKPQTSYFSQNIWLNPMILKIESIADAANKLKDMQRNWAVYSFKLHRRAQLIQDKLPYIPTKPMKFLQKVPESPLGSWTLLDENTILASPHCTSFVPNGEWNFQEDHENPPSRAYLKLWEFFTRLQKYPNKNDVCLDLGASPGGWTWVLRKLGASVIAYDRAYLDLPLQQDEKVTFYDEDCFKVKPETHPEVSWVFSDVIAYPGKVLPFVRDYVKACPDKNFVFTLKFQGTNHYQVIENFMEIPGSKIMHLSHNKHELTWYRLVDRESK